MNFTSHFRVDPTATMASCGPPYSHAVIMEPWTSGPVPQPAPLVLETAMNLSLFDRNGTAQ